MRVARMLLATSRRRSPARIFGGGRGGKGNWQVALVVIFGICGTASLVYVLIKMLNVKNNNRRGLIIHTAYILLVTILFCSPAIVVLALKPSLAVGILCIISLSFLSLPLLIWIPVAVKKFRHCDSSRKVEEISAEQVFTANNDDQRPYPANNFVPQASAGTYPTTADNYPPIQSPQQWKRSADGY